MEKSAVACSLVERLGSIWHPNEIRNIELRGVNWRINVTAKHSQESRSDEDLMQEVKRGDQDAFAELMGRYELRLFNYLRRTTGNAADAEDVYQEAFLRVYRHAKRFREDANFRPWLYRIATNLCMDLIRKRKRRNETSLEADGIRPDSSLSVRDLAPSPAQSSEREERRAALASAVDLLPAKQRVVFLLARYEGLGYSEIAQSVGVPIGTVKSRMNAAVKRLKDQLSEKQV